MGKLGQLLVARSWITVQQLTRALQNQHAVGGRLGTCLLEMEALGEDLLARSLSEQLGVPAAAIEDLRGIPDEVLHLIPEKLARRCRAIPFRVAGGRLDVAMQDPRNLVCQDEIAFACGRRVKVHVLHELRIYEALQRYYREECPSRYSLLSDRLNRARYLWGGGDTTLSLTRGAKAGPAGPATAPAGRGRGAGEEVTEVLSALPPSSLLDAPPRMAPPPLPEPALPPSPRKRSLFRSRQQPVPEPAATPTAPTADAKAAPAAPPAVPEAAGPVPTAIPAVPAAAAAAEPGAPRAPAPPAESTVPPAPIPPSSPISPVADDAHLPPLAEVDLRATPRRLRVLEAARKPPTSEILAVTAPAAAAPPAPAPASPPAAAVGPAATSPPAAPSPAAPPAAAATAATAAAGERSTPRAPDLETTMVLRPPRVATPRPPAVPGRTSGSQPVSPSEAGGPAGPAAAPPASPPALRLTAARPTLVPPADGPAHPRDSRDSRDPRETPRKVELTAAERDELGVGAAPPAAPAEPVREAPTTLEEVEAAFARTTDLAEVGRILLGFLGHSYRRVALFQASRKGVSGWMAHGEGIDQEAFGRYTASFAEPSVFLNLRQGSGIHLGPLPPMQAHRELTLCWGGGLPRDCVVLPVRLKDRLVTAIYADGGSRGMWGIDLDRMQRLTAATATAFERCIVDKKRGYAQS